jgi:hypothetical protein
MILGREWIIYILENGLENEPIYEDGKLLGFMDEVEAAMKFDVGYSTIRTWYQFGYLKGVTIGGTLYIPANAEDPRPKIERSKLQHA